MSNYFDKQYHMFNVCLERLHSIFNNAEYFMWDGTTLILKIAVQLYELPEYKKLNRNWRERLNGHKDELHLQIWRKVAWVLCHDEYWFSNGDEPENIDWSKVYGGHHVWLKDGIIQWDKSYTYPDEQRVGNDVK